MRNRPVRNSIKGKIKVFKFKHSPNILDILFTFPVEKEDKSIPKEIESLLNKGYVILPKPWHLRYSVYMEY